jgi:hypothetical protein
MSQKKATKKTTRKRAAKKAAVPVSVDDPINPETGNPVSWGRKSGPPREKVRTPENREIILKALSYGMSQEDACRVAGISKAPFFIWKKEDPEFAEEVRQSRHQAKYVLLNRLFKAAENPKHWKAAAYLLPRIAPEYNLQKQVKLSGNVGSSPFGELNELIDHDPQAADLYEALLQRLAASRSGGTGGDGQPVLGAGSAPALPGPPAS